jgi:Na+-translocating ferredoxin:NAD+ oxidoreductase RnfG subunit
MFCENQITGEDCGDPVINIHTMEESLESVDSIPVLKSNIAPKQKKQNNVSARAARINTKPVNVLARAQDKVADGGAVAINCPAGCTPDCAILGNVVLCECKASDGSTCKADVVTSENTTGVK